MDKEAVEVVGEEVVVVVVLVLAAALWSVTRCMYQFMEIQLSNGFELVDCLLCPSGDPPTQPRHLRRGGGGVGGGGLRAVVLGGPAMGQQNLALR